MFGMHEQLSLRVCLLKILLNGWCLGKHLSTMSRNSSKVVLTLLSHGGLCQVIFHFRALLFLVVLATFFKRLLVWVIASFKTCSVGERLVIRLLINVLRDVFSNAGGWFLTRWT